MDPPHITEFASERYFDKIKQLREQQQRDAQVIEGPSIEPSRFILPIRGAEAIEVDDSFVKPELRVQEKEKDKKSIFGRLRHSKSTVDVQGIRRPSVEAAKSRQYVILLFI